MVEPVDYIGQVLLNILGGQTGRYEPHPSIDVVSDASGRNDTVLNPGCCDAADRKTIAPVNIRHRDGIAHDARQVSYIAHLLQTLITLGIREQVPGCVNSTRHSHLSRFGNLPQVVMNSLKLHSVPPA